MQGKTSSNPGTYNVHGLSAIHVREWGDEQRGDTTKESVAGGEVAGLLLRDFEIFGDGPKGRGDEARTDWMALAYPTQLSGGK
jgi:hypothetical protein